MTTTIDVAFIANFEAEVHVQYLAMGSKLRNTVRNKNAITEASTTFMQVRGVPASADPAPKPVECVLADYPRWYCPRCDTEVPASCVTKDETHDRELLGCGERVFWENPEEEPRDQIAGIDDRRIVSKRDLIK